MGSPNAIRPYWCCRRDRKAKRGAQTTGVTKGCTAKPLIRYLSGHNRSYKHRAYPLFIAKCIRNNGRVRLTKIP